MATEKNPRPARAKAAAEALITTIVAGAALVLLNVLSCGWKTKSDLTADQIYSLLPASKHLVQRLPEKLTVKAYFGNVPAEQQEQRRYVDNLLAEYADSSKGKLVYEKYEVDASDAKDAAARQKELEDDGIHRLMIPLVNEEGAKEVPAYFNVQFNYLDKKETWQLPTSTFVAEGLEYEFTTIIKRLSDGKPKLGITKGFGEVEQHQIIDLPGKDTGMGTKLGLADLYEIVPVDWAKTPKQIEDVDVLIVYGPTQKVSDAALYYLDQHIMKGKPTLLLVPGMNWAPAPQQQQQMPPDAAPAEMFMGTPVDNGMKDLLANYGFEIGADTILDITNGVPGVIPLGQRPAPGKLFFPLVAAVSNGKNQPLQGMKAMPLPYASTLKLIGPLAQGAKVDDYEVLQLFTTSPTSFARTDFLMVNKQTQLAQPTSRAAMGPYLAGVAVSGKWTSFFAGKDKPAGVDAPGPSEDPTAMVSDAGEPTIAASQKPARILVVSSAKWAQDESIAQIRFARTPVFLNCFVALHSMIDWATESTDLLAVRAKQVLRPLDPISKSKRLWVTYGNIGGAPLAMILFGIVYWQVRERRRRRVRL